MFNWNNMKFIKEKHLLVILLIRKMKKNLKKILNGINDKLFDENIDSDLKDLIVNCLNINPEKRFKMEDIKKHKFYSKNEGF